jgi:hypothetical protein
MISVHTRNTQGTELVISGRRLLKLDTVDAGFEDNTRYNKMISGKDHSRRQPVPSLAVVNNSILYNTTPVLFIDAWHLGLSS